MRAPLPGATVVLVAALLASGGAKAAASCREIVAVLPFELLVADRGAAASAEASVREAMEALNPGCVEPRAETVKRLKAAGGRIPSCADDLCRSQWVKSLQARWLVHGVAIGAGGRTSVALSLWGEQGESGRQLASAHGEEVPAPPRKEAPPSPARAHPPPPGPETAARGGSAPRTPVAASAPSVESAPAPATALSDTAPRGGESSGAAAPVSLKHAVRTLWSGRTPLPRSGPDLGLAPHVAIGAGAAALIGGALMGMQAQRTAADLSGGSAGCPPETFSSCFERRLADGRNQALWANLLYATGGVMTAGGAVLLVWTLP